MGSEVVRKRCEIKLAIKNQLSIMLSIISTIIILKEKDISLLTNINFTIFSRKVPKAETFPSCFQLLTRTTVLAPCAGALIWRAGCT